jgi:signal transduction histidine kinase/ligand-binding sensor domain-containing protein
MRLVCACVLAATWWATEAYGLDPSHALTQYIHRVWQVAQGLPQPSIYSIWQTHDGYLWLGTPNGLFRFDGVRFTAIYDPRQPALKNAWIEGMVEDEQRNLWIGTSSSGLFRLHDGLITRFSLSEGLPSESVYCLVSGRGDSLWICTGQGMAQFSGGRLWAYGAQQGLPGGEIDAACEAPDGTLWLTGTTVRLGTWNGGQYHPYPLQSLPEDGEIHSLLCSHTGAVWAGTSDGLIRIQRGQERRFMARDGLADNRVLSLAESADGSLWIGTQNGFSRMRGAEIDSFLPKDGLSQSSVFALFEDREGSLWVGTKHGLNQFLDGRAVPITASEGLPSNDTGPVLQDRNGVIWVGTQGAGLARFDGRRFAVLTAREGLVGNSVNALAEDANGDLWVATDAGLNRLRKGRVAATYGSGDGLPAGTVQSLFLDREGALWIGASGGAARLQHGRILGVPSAPGSQPGPILAFGEDRDGRILAAVKNGGMLAMKGGELSEFAPNGMSVRDADAFYRDQDGLLWIGTLGNGLRLWKDGKLVAFSVRDGLFDDEIYGIAGDSQDRLWMACSQGIFSVKRSDLLGFASGAIRSFESTPYVPTEALRTIECKPGVEPAVWKMRDGVLWFSTIRGLLVIDPRRLQRNVPPPEVVIEDVVVNGRSERPTRIEALAPGQKNVEFRYTALSFLLAGRTTFRYRLEGYDKDWVQAETRREAEYTNLPPGKYLFRVTACNVDGTCNQAGTAVSFALAPHFYQRPWFLPLLAVSIALAVWLAYRLRIRRLKDQFRIILAERNRIARELHDTLIQGFSGVTMQMQALAARLAHSGERGTLNEIILDAGSCLKEARQSVAGLRSGEGPTSGLSTAIAGAARQLTEASDVRLKLKLDQTPPGLAADAEYNLFRIAQEALTNSVKHSGARTIEVVLRSAPGSVRLSVKDDGSGLPAGNGGYSLLGHYGLVGMKERAKQIGAELKLESEPGQGTQVTVVLPAKRTAAAGSFSSAPASGKRELSSRSEPGPKDAS